MHQIMHFNKEKSVYTMRKRLFSGPVLDLANEFQPFYIKLTTDRSVDPWPYFKNSRWPTHAERIQHTESHILSSIPN